LWNAEKVSKDNRIWFSSLIREMNGGGGSEFNTKFLFEVTEKKKLFGSPSSRFEDNIKVDHKQMY
jgi:hypothetical protein